VIVAGADDHVRKTADRGPVWPRNAGILGDFTYYAAGLHGLQSAPESLPHDIPSGEALAMAKKKGKSKKKLEVMYLVCEETGDYNYTIRRKPGGEKLKIKKFSPRLRRHTVHNEKKK
jgi:large subunit ribosomal protein L33